MGAADRIEHVIVVMLENRSFDNMLGWTFNPEQMPKERDASKVLPRDPDHAHCGVMWQMLGAEQNCDDLKSPLPTGPLTMSGFADSYTPIGGDGRLVLRGFRRDAVPVLTTLAQEFAVCTRWFCSVPGQTWPNRNFAHAGTADGEVDIKVRPYWNDTIFERLEDAGRTWRVYHQGPAQVWCFPRLVLKLGNRFDDHEDLLRDIQADRLPTYAFVEPDHGLIFREARDRSNSQHPHNNTTDERDFDAGEQLLHDIYTTLATSPAWRKTLLVVTYDEHGGFADHVAPPDNATPPPEVSDIFAFRLLGPRVPTVLVSPWIPRGTIDARTYEHASIPRSLRALFAPHAADLGGREANAAPFLDNLSLAVLRTDVPVTEPRPSVRAAPRERVRVASAALAQEPRPLDDMQESLVALSELVDRMLREQHTAPEPRRGTAEVRETRNVRPPARQYTTEAERQLYLADVTRRVQRGARPD